MHIYYEFYVFFTIYMRYTNLVHIKFAENWKHH